MKIDIPQEKQISTSNFRRGIHFQPSKVKILIENEFKAVWFNRKGMISHFIDPLLYLVFFMAGLRGMTGNVQLAGGEEIDYLTFTLPGILLLLAIRLMAHTVYRSTIDKRWGLLALKFMNGVSPLTYVCGLVTYPAVMFLGQGIILALLSLFYGITYSPYNLFFALSVGLLAIVFWCSVGILITTRINDYQQRDLIMGLLLFPIMFTSPTFYAIETAPLYIQYISWINPVTYQVTAVRSIFIDHPDIVAILITSIITLCVLFFAIRMIGKADLIGSEH